MRHVPALCAKALVAFCAMSASAASASSFAIFDNVADAEIVSGSTVSNARYRFSFSNFDAAFFDGSAPTDQANLGNLAALNDTTFGFSLSFDAGSRTFTYQIGGETLTDTLASGETFNALQLSALARDRDSQRPCCADAVNNYLDAESLMFATGGALVGLDDLKATPSAGEQLQFLVAGMALDGVDWTLTGQLTGAFFGRNTSNEDVKFDVRAVSSDADVGIIPLPAAAWLLMTGLAGLGAIARKRD